MYEIIRRALERGGYTQEEARARLAYLVADGRLSPEQAEELTALALERADPGAGGIEAEVQELRDEVGELREANSVLTAAVSKTAELGLSASKRAEVAAILDAGAVREQVAPDAEAKLQER